MRAFTVSVELAEHLASCSRGVSPKKGTFRDLKDHGRVVGVRPRNHIVLIIGNSCVRGCEVWALAGARQIHST